MAADLTLTRGVPASRIAVLPNPIDTEAIGARAGEKRADWPEASAAGPHLLAVGRLSREKGFDLLIQALAQVRSVFPSADLLIAGAGPEEESLRNLCAELNLEDAVRIAGHVDAPAVYFAGATLFVLSSRHEGLPNALLEAAAGGLPIAALPSSQGVVDLLRGHAGVWLAEQISADSLARICWRRWARSGLGSSGRVSGSRIDLSSHSGSRTPSRNMKR